MSEQQQQECEVAGQATATESEAQPTRDGGEEPGELMRVTMANAEVTPAQARAGGVRGR